MNPRVQSARWYHVLTYWIMGSLLILSACDDSGNPPPISSASKSNRTTVPSETAKIEMSKEQQFWSWFVENEDRLFYFERDQNSVFAALRAALHAVDTDLTFEFSAKASPQREFIISADGIKSAFPAVKALTEAAPELPRWKIIAFRPRGPAGSTIEIDDITVDPAKVQYILLEYENKVGIALLIPGYREQDSRFKTIGFLLLDNTLGEYDVATKIGPIEFLDIAANIDGKRYPLLQLAEHLDILHAEASKCSN